MKYCVVEQQSSEMYNHIHAGGDGVDPLEIQRLLPASPSKPFAWIVRTADGFCYVRSIGEPRRRSVNGRLYEPTVPQIAMIWVDAVELGERYHYSTAELDRIIGLPPEPLQGQSADVRKWVQRVDSAQIVLLGAGPAASSHRLAATAAPEPLPQAVVVAPLSGSAFFRFLPVVVVLILLIALGWVRMSLSGRIEDLRAQLEQQKTEQLSRNPQLVAALGKLDHLGESVTKLKEDVRKLQEDRSKDFETALEPINKRLTDSIAELKGAVQQLRESSSAAHQKEKENIDSIYKALDGLSKKLDEIKGGGGTSGQHSRTRSGTSPSPPVSAA